MICTGFPCSLASSASTIFCPRLDVFHRGELSAPTTRTQPRLTTLFATAPPQATIDSSSVARSPSAKVPVRQNVLPKKEMGVSSNSIPSFPCSSLRDFIAAIIRSRSSPVRFQAASLARAPHHTCPAQYPGRRCACRPAAPLRKPAVP